MEVALTAIRSWLAKRYFKRMGECIFPYVQWMNPNWLTVARIPLTVVVMLILRFMWYGLWLWLAEATFILASLLDMLDGWLAREKEVASKMGDFLDGLADRFLVGGVSLCLIIMLDKLTFTLMLGFLIIFDLPIWMIGNNGRTKTYHYIFGKYKMCSQSITIGLLILHPIEPQVTIYAFLFFILAMFFTFMNIKRHLQT